MSSECDQCGEYPLDCECKRAEGWVNVKDEAPICHQRVLLCDEKSSVYVGTRQAEYDEFDLFEIDEWYEDDNGMKIGLDIFFWKELPEAPSVVTLPFHEYKFLKQESRKRIFELKLRA